MNPKTFLFTGVFLLLSFLNPLLAQSQESGIPPFLSRESVWADSVLQTLSREERIAQLLMVAAYSNRGPAHIHELSNLVEDYGVGGLIFFQGGPHRQALIHNHLQHISQVPLLVCMDAEWGIGMRLDSTQSFPYQMALGAIQDESLIYEMGKEIGRQFSRMGMHINFAPVVDINNNPANPVINYRAFGEEKENVISKGLAYMKGMQDAHLLATAKHFPGHGDTDVDSHENLPVIKHGMERLQNVELAPFQALQKAGVGGVMVAHMSIPTLDPTPQLPSTLSYPIVTELLQEKMGFQGLVMTDALNMKGVTKFYEPGEVDAKALIAGNDMMLFSENVPRAIEEISKAIDRGDITEETLNNKCRKVLLTKAWSFKHVPRQVATRDLIEDLNTAEAEVLIRELFGSALTVLKNEDQLIPLKDLEQKNIALLSISRGQEGKPFYEALSKYAPITYYHLEPDSDPSQIALTREALNKHNQVIVGVHQLFRRPINRMGFNSHIQALIEELSGPGQIMTFFRNPYTLQHTPAVSQADGLIVAYQNDPACQEMAAQMIFGAIGAKGKLPVSIGTHFKAGDGIETQGGIRLGYTLPEAVGWDGQTLSAQLDSIVLAGIAAKAFPGCQLLVAKDQQVIFHKTYGYHTYDSIQPVGYGDLYDFASVTKVTGPLPALMKLHGEGIFDLDTTFSTYWPDFKRSNKKDLNVREILAHQARLQAWIAYWTTAVKPNQKFRMRTFKSIPHPNYPIKIHNHLFLHKSYKKRQIYKQIRKSPLLDSASYVYSGLSFYLYPEIIEHLTGENYESYLNQNFYHALGANTITYNPFQDYPLSRIVPTERDTFFRMEQIHGRVHDEGAVMMGGVSGNAGLFGTANDLAKLAQMYANMGRYGGEQLIDQATMEEFTRYQYPKNRRGLGFDKPMLEEPEKGYVAASASPESFGHSGYTGTFFWVDPKYDLVLIFFSNRVFPTRLNTRLYSLNIRPSLHQVLYDQIQKHPGESP